MTHLAEGHKHTCFCSMTDKTGRFFEGVWDTGLAFILPDDDMDGVLA